MCVCVCVCVQLLFVRVTGGRLLGACVCVCVYYCCLVGWCVCATAVCQSDWW